MAKRSHTPSKRQILTYWVDSLIKEKYWLDIFLDAKTKIEKEQSECICFACGTIGYTERCHIDPYSKTENNKVSNIHLLCKECHTESECLTSKAYWDWFYYKNPSNSASLKRHISTVSFIVETVLKDNGNPFKGIYSELYKIAERELRTN